jgi:hypothetical protein
VPNTHKERWLFFILFFFSSLFAFLVLYPVAHP